MTTAERDVGAATALILRLERDAVLAAVRRAVRHPTRRTLWGAVVALALIAVAVEIATAGSGSHSLGTWTPHPLAVVAAACAIVAIAALAGRRTTLTYGTRAADATWWRYAGVDSAAGRRATTAVLTLRVTAAVAAVAVPFGVLLAVTDTTRAAAVATIVLAAIAVAPLTVLASSATASRTGEPRSPDLFETAEAPQRSTPDEIPRGILAARWLVARRRREPVMPWFFVVAGGVTGYALPWLAARAGGQVVALAVVIGGFALILDGALRRTTAPSMLLTPWWRAAIGTSAPALVAWALADVTAIIAFAGAAAVCLGTTLRVPVLGIATVPLVAAVPVVLRLTALAVDTVFPADRLRLGAFARVAAVGVLTLLAATLALVAGARAGFVASIGTATGIITALIYALANICARRLEAVT